MKRDGNMHFIGTDDIAGVEAIGMGKQSCSMVSCADEDG